MDPDGLSRRARRFLAPRRRRAARRASMGGGPRTFRLPWILLACACLAGAYGMWPLISTTTRPEIPPRGESPPAAAPLAAPDQGADREPPDPAGEGSRVGQAPEEAMGGAAATPGDGASSSASPAADVPMDVPVLAMEPDGAAPVVWVPDTPEDAKPGAAEARVAAEKGVSPQGRQKQSAAPRPGNLFTLVVEGRLGGERLSGNDRQTWARLGYFLREEAARPFFLVFPGGSMPLIVPASSAAGPKAAPTAKESKRPAAAPAGDPALPDYRLVVRASSQAEGDITFYGRSMASKYRCDISCSIERRSGKSFRAIDRVSATELWTPSTLQKIDGPAALRKVYDVCLDRLVKRLAERPFFTRK